MIPPSFNYVIEMTVFGYKNMLPQYQIVPNPPEFTFSITFSCMNMDRFVPFIE